MIYRNTLGTTIIQDYYMTTIVRALGLAAERTLFFCHGRAIWNFFSARRLFRVVSKTYVRVGENNGKDGQRYNYIFNNWKKN